MNRKEQFANFQKLNQSQWENIEVPISDFEKKVCDVMKSIGVNSSNNIGFDSGEEFEVLGEEIYNTILRPILIKNSFLQLSAYDNLQIHSAKADSNKEIVKENESKNNKKSKNAKDKNSKKSVNSLKVKNPNKEEQMLQSINKDKLEKKLLTLIEYYKIKEKSNSQHYEIEQEYILEFKLILLFFISKNFIQSYSLNNRESYLELVMGFSTVIKRLDHELSEYNLLNKSSEKQNSNRNKNNLILLKKLNKNNQTEININDEIKLNNDENLNENSKKFIDHITKKPSIFSTTCLKDFENILSNMKILADFNSLEVITNYPKLLISNIVTERYFKIKYIKAFSHQVELVEILKDSFSNFNEKKNLCKIKPNLVYLKTPIGSGKTTIALAIASLIDQIRSNTNLQDYSLIFACSIDIVREYIGRIAYNSQISFGIANSYFSEINLVKSWSCKNVKNVNLIITDYRTARFLLNKSNNKNYILFIDEPTNQADKLDSHVLTAFCSLFKSAPPNTILSSATLPPREQMLAFENYFKYFAYNTANVTSISSGNSLIGCQVNCIADFQGYFPHHCCQDKNELLAVYKEAFDDPLLSRFYNSFTLIDLYSKMKLYFDVEGEIENNNNKNNINFDEGENTGKSLNNFSENKRLKLPNIELYFSDIENMTYSNIVKKCKELLMILINTKDDEIIRKVCSCEAEFCVLNFKGKF